MIVKNYHKSMQNFYPENLTTDPNEDYSLNIYTKVWNERIPNRQNIFRLKA